MIKPTALTVKAKGIASVITTQITVQIPHTTKSVTITAIWDTGATNTCITSGVVAALGLVPTGMTQAHTANGIAQQNTYTVDIILPNALMIPDVSVTEVPGLSGGCDSLIGMDIITIGDFSITNFAGITCMSFRIPSAQEIDYVTAINAKNALIPKKQPSLSGPCPCGSGKKYKACCGKLFKNKR